MGDVVNMAGAIDLGAYHAEQQARAENVHLWIIQTFFSVNDDTMTRLAARRHEIASLTAVGNTAAAVEVGDVPLLMDEGALYDLDGPGCIKCGAHWEDLEKGFGQGCPVTDEDFRARKEQAHNGREQFHAVTFQQLVASLMPAPTGDDE